MEPRRHVPKKPNPQNVVRAILERPGDFLSVPRGVLQRLADAWEAWCALEGLSDEDLDFIANVADTHATIEEIPAAHRVRDVMLKLARQRNRIRNRLVPKKDDPSGDWIRTDGTRVRFVEFRGRMVRLLELEEVRHYETSRQAFVNNYRRAAK